MEQKTITDFCPFCEQVTEIEIRREKSIFTNIDECDIYCCTNCGEKWEAVDAQIESDSAQTLKSLTLDELIDDNDNMPLA